MKKMWMAIGTCVVGATLLTGCSSDDNNQPTVPVMANAEGWTQVFPGQKNDDIKKRCDGTTLVYRMQYIVPQNSNGGLSVIPNSPECGYKPPVPATVTVTVSPSATPSHTP